MTMSAKYQFTASFCGGPRQLTILARDYYNGSLHVTLLSDQGDYEIPKTVSQTDEGFSFAAGGTGFAVENAGDRFAVRLSTGETATGTVAPITAEDDRTSLITHKYRALILYSSMTGNTERVAEAIKAQLEHYCFQVDMIKITSKATFNRDFSGYDLVCLGSLIIAGAPSRVVYNKMSLGGSAMPNGDPLPAGGPAGMPPKPDMEGMLTDKGSGAMGQDANTPMAATYAGGPSPRNIYHPLGLVFTTYGGGFYGSDEAIATLETLKLYLELQNVKVVGKFACCGRESGPAGLLDGEIPTTISGVKLDPPVYYRDADGKYHAGSFFFHTHMQDKPAARDLEKARILVSDLVEDYFYTCDGMRREPSSPYISIS